MSRQLVSRSPDLKRLQDEGYDIEISNSNYLLVRVPYVTASETGLLRNPRVGPDTARRRNGRAWQPTSSRSLAQAEGDIPCDNHGHELTDLINQRGPVQLGGNLIASCTFSHKPNPDLSGLLREDDDLC